MEIRGTGKGSGADPVTGVTKAVVHDLCGACEKGWSSFLKISPS